MDSANLVVNRHPLLIDHESQVAVDLEPGESLYRFLHRHIANLNPAEVAVYIGGAPVPLHMWHHVRPKNLAAIEVRSTVHRSALFLVAMIALTAFTAGAGAFVAAGGSIFGLGAVGSMAVVGAMQVVGALLINKVLGPKPEKPQALDRDSVFSLDAARNSVRPYEPFGLLFGQVRVTPDYLSKPYAQFRGNDQYLSMLFTPGINVASYGDLYIGDTPLSNYQEVQVWQRGFSAMAQQTIPISTNVDTIAGGTLDAGVPVERTSPLETVRLQIDIAFLLFDLTNKGKKKNNQETVRVEYRVVGAPTWTLGGNYSIVSSEQSEQRRSYFIENLPADQYEVRVMRLGLDTDGSGATCEFNWVSLVAYQNDDANYDGIAQLGMEIKASGQLNGTPDQVRAVMKANPVPLWNGTSWVMAATRATGLSNAAANTLQYIRGYYDEHGELIAGMGWPDSRIDLESFKAWMLHCTDMDYNYDAWITSERNHEEMLQALALAGMGAVDFGPGKATAIWAAENQGVDAIVNMGTIKKASFQVNYTLVQAADGIEYTYFDRTDWTTKTLRVVSPERPEDYVPLNPARLTGEGITSESHAAIMARYHMGQMAYQFKDISYSTDLEHLAYNRMSMVQLSHDLTQWGYSGRVREASIFGGIVTLVLDDKVPPPGVETGFIGLRIPGEQTYRVFEVAEFFADTDTITLAESWPAGVPLPGNNSENPAHDTIWIYDFKATPGLRARVVAIAPEDDLRGAQVAVVPEGPEFWNYVITGEYVPPVSGSLLNTRPAASALRVTKVRVVQGDTVFVRFSATWECTGKAEYFTVSCNGDEVARVTTLKAVWREDEAGEYTIVVRPFGEGGVPGTAVALTINSDGANTPPVIVDNFDVEETPSGLRRYTWSFDPGTIQSPDFAGVQIRYIAGSTASPVWDDMSELGGGIETGLIESPQPPAGVWTFACRSVNTSGTLSIEARVVTRTLVNNLDEQVTGIIDDQTALYNALAAEAVERFNEDVRVANEAAADATAKADAALAAALAAVDEAVGAVVPWDDETDYDEGQMVTDGGFLYLALQDVPAGTLLTDTLYWQNIGSYSSLGEAVAASISIGEANTTELEAQASQIDAVEASLASKADASAVTALDTRVTETEGDISTLASSLSAVETSLAGKADASAVSLLEGRVDDVEGEVTSLASAITTINAELADKAEASAVTSLASTVSTQGGLIAANSSAISSLNTTVGDHSASLITIGQVNAGADFTDVRNGSFETSDGWGGNTTGTTALPSGVSYTNTVGHTRTGAYALRSDGEASARYVYNAGRTSCKTGEQFRVGLYVRRAPTAPSGGTVSVGIRCYDATGTYVSGSAVSISKNVASLTTSYELLSTLFTIPETAVTFGIWVSFSHTAGGVIADDVFATRLGEDVVNLRASWTLALTVDGYVSGIRSENTGTSSSLDIHADYFRILKPGGGARTEFSSGNWRVYDGSGQLRVRMGIW